MITVTDENGLIVKLITENIGGTTNTRVDEYHIDAAIIDGICAVTVNGRDIEDGIAPLEIIASIIEAKMKIVDRDLPWPDQFPDWLTNWSGESDQEFRDMYSLTPLVVLLGTLTCFGGDQDTASL